MQDIARGHSAADEVGVVVVVRAPLTWIRGVYTPSNIKAHFPPNICLYTMWCITNTIVLYLAS